MDLTYILIGITVCVSVAGQYLLKIGMGAVGKIDSIGQLLTGSTLFKMLTTWQIPVALVLYAAGAFLWMVVLSREDLNFAYPFIGLTYILILVVGHFALGEAITTPRVMGTLLVAVGVVVVARG